MRNLEQIGKLSRRSFMGGLVGLMTLGLAACGTTSDATTASLASAPIPEGMARVKLNRVNTLLYAGAPATITLNGKTVANIGVGGTTLVDVPVGDNVIAASAWSYPGEFALNLKATPDTLYTIEVSPRAESFGPSTFLGPLGGVIDASINKNAGAFQMRFVE